MDSAKAGFFCCVGQIDGLACGGDRLGKWARFGIGGGKRVEKDRFPTIGKPGRLLRQGNGLGPVANRGLGGGRQNPGQVVQIGDVVGLRWTAVRK